MEKTQFQSKSSLVLSRRSFVKMCAVAGSATTLVGCGALSGSKGEEQVIEQAGSRMTGAKIVPSICLHNCGGRCQLKAHVKDNVIVAFSTDDSGTHELANPQARACLRGRSQRRRLYHPDRLKYPMKRVGERGEGKFERISWDEALDTVASELKRIKETYGPESIYYQYASGSLSNFNLCYYGGPSGRLLNMFGGHLNFYGNYSQACYMYATPFMFGKSPAGNSTSDFVNSKLIVLFGDNPASTRMGGVNSSYYLIQAKKKGARVIIIDPRYSDTAQAIADQWIPIKPTTDAALVAALAYVLINENLYNQDFMSKYCVGFDEDTLPEGVPAGNSYKSYVLGESDGIAKTPQWASDITGIPVNTIINLAREIGMTKPCFILQGRGVQRHANGEQISLAIPILAAMTGNIGVSGGGPGLYESGPPVSLPGLPVPPNPVTATISFFLWTDAIFRGTEMTPEKDGLVGTDRLKSNIKFIWNYAGNALINQHADTGRTAEILKDTSKAEFILVIDNFMTPSAKFADILLPDCTQFEQQDVINRSMGVGVDYFGDKAVEPMYECRTMYDICTDIADRLGFKDQFTEGKTQEDWIKEIVEGARAKNPDFPSYEEFKATGIYKNNPKEPIVAYKKFVEDPVANPLSTPSGKIEIFSKALYDMNNSEIPAIPKYMPAIEGPDDSLKEKYPLQCIGFHYKRRVHSTFDNIDWLDEAAAQVIWMNPEDAKNRGIEDGTEVKIFNDRGTIVMPVKITPRIIPGVCAIPQGGWYSPDANKVDHRGCINTITSQRPTALAKGNPQHTNLVQIEKA